MSKNNNIDPEIKENIKGNVDNETLNSDAINEKLKLLEKKEQEIKESLISLDEKLSALDLKQKEINDSMGVFNKTKEYSLEKLKNDSIDTGKELSKQEKVTIIIPKSELNPNDKSVPVTINGYTYNILRGERVSVPLEVANILQESKYI